MHTAIPLIMHALLLEERDVALDQIGQTAHLFRLIFALSCLHNVIITKIQWAGKF